MATRIKKTKAAEKAPAAAEVEPEQIALRAYEIYESEGGEPLENWLRAERELGVAPALEAAA